MRRRRKPHTTKTITETAKATQDLSDPSGLVDKVITENTEQMERAADKLREAVAKMHAIAETIKRTTEMTELRYNAIMEKLQEEYDRLNAYDPRKHFDFSVVGDILSAAPKTTATFSVTRNEVFYRFLPYFFGLVTQQPAEQPCTDFSLRCIADHIPETETAVELIKYFKANTIVLTSPTSRSNKQTNIHTYTQLIN